MDDQEAPPGILKEDRGVHLVVVRITVGGCVATWPLTYCQDGKQAMDIRDEKLGFVEGVSGARLTVRTPQGFQPVGITVGGVLKKLGIDAVGYEAMRMQVEPLVKAAPSGLIVPN